MMFEYYYITDDNNNSNCVVRSLCKVLNRTYENVYSELNKLANKYKLSFNDIKVFETYMKNNNIIKTNIKPDLPVKDIIFLDGTYIVFCYDKNDYYHMFPIINNVIYDKNDKCLNLYTISVYQKIM